MARDSLLASGKLPLSIELIPCFATLQCSQKKDFAISSIQNGDVLATMPIIFVALTC
jgi:hypothetical protein